LRTGKTETGDLAVTRQTGRQTKEEYRDGPGERGNIEVGGKHVEKGKRRYRNLKSTMRKKEKQRERIKSEEKELE